MPRKVTSVSIPMEYYDYISGNMLSISTMVKAGVLLHSGGRIDDEGNAI